MTYADKIHQQELLKRPARFARRSHPVPFCAQRRIKIPSREVTLCETAFWLFIFFAAPIAISYITGWTP